MQFSNPIVGGAGSLVRQSIHSPDYMAGVSGWTINKDGTAEFNATTIRGDLRVVGDDGSVIWIRELPNTDPFYADNAVIQLYPPNLDPDAYPAVLSADTPFATLPRVSLTGPGLDVGGVLRAATLSLQTDTDANYRYASVSAEDLSFGVPSTVDPYYLGSRANLIVENVIVESELLLASGDIRSTATPTVSTGAWAGFREGVYREDDGNGLAAVSGDIYIPGTITTSSGTFVANPFSATEGITFTTGQSGKVDIHFGAELYAGSAIGQVLSYEIRTGNTVGSGTLIVASNDERTVRSFGTNRYQMSRHIPHTLTPFTQYNARIMYRSASGGTNASFDRRSLAAIPRIL